jgi:hypothetical protein
MLRAKMTRELDTNCSPQTLVWTRQPGPSQDKSLLEAVIMFSWTSDILGQ